MRKSRRIVRLKFQRSTKKVKFYLKINENPLTDLTDKRSLQLNAGDRLEVFAIKTEGVELSKTNKRHE